MLLAAASLNHVLAQNAWALQRLIPLSGKTFAVHVAPLPTLRFTLLPDGYVADAEPEAFVEASLSATPDALLRYFAVQPRDPSLIQIGGDTQLGAEIGHILAHITWEAEEDLSRLFGDILAHRMAGLGRDLWQWRKQSALNLATAASEYFTEERPLIAKRSHIEQFAQEVSLVRAATDSLEIRIENLLNRQAAK